MKKMLFTVFIFLNCLVLGVYLDNDSANKQAQAALEEFYTCECMSDKLAEPLRGGGSRIVPLVIENVKNKNMLRRGAAIDFLGSKGNFQALQVLEEIVTDSNESDYGRKHTLNAIFRIDENEARRIANQYKDNDNFLGNYSRCILTEDRCV